MLFPRPARMQPAAIRTVALAAALGVLFAAPTQTLAQDSETMICSEPVVPTCIDSELTFEDEQRIDRCRSDVQGFREDIRTYIECLSGKIERQKDVRDRVTDQLECRADPEQSC